MNGAPTPRSKLKSQPQSAKFQLQSPSRASSSSAGPAPLLVDAAAAAPPALPGANGHRDGGGRGDMSARRRLAEKLGVRRRTPMGEYIPDADGPLTALALPTPSPHSYTPHTASSGRCISILGKPTSPTTAAELTPGPQKYNTSAALSPWVVPTAPAWSFAGRQRTPRRDEAEPAGGMYCPTQGGVGTDAPMFSMAGRYEVAVSSEPGPDHYFPPASAVGHTTAPSYTFGTKPVTTTEPTPGPQSYDTPAIPPHAPTAPHHSFGARVGDAVFGDEKHALGPAPSAYFPKLTWNAKAATLKGWYTESKALKTPGPANYIIPNALFSGPQFSMIGRNAPGEDADAPRPGPATYTPDAAATRARGPAYTLKSRAETAANPKKNPGPGSYTPRDRQLRGNDGQKATMKGRWRDLLECTPGPADYSPTRHLTRAQLARIDAARGGQAKPKTAPKPPVHHPTPGPGTYTPRLVTTPAKPGFTLGKRLDGPKLPSSAPPRLPPTSTPESHTDHAPKRAPCMAASFKSRASPYVTVFPTVRVDTLRVLV